MERPIGLTIGEVSRRTGCNIETIRYYERVGLLPPPARHGRYRRYGSDDVVRLSFVRRARALGFTLDEIRALMALSAETKEGCAEARSLAAAHLADVRARITDLRAMERALAAAVRRCDEGEAAACPLISTLAERPHRRG